jgi:Abnormal spindle-like microcephaly-assoc'd, ASPM-SPD-2-Hydin/Beta-propeller repeat
MNKASEWANAMKFLSVVTLLCGGLLLTVPGGAGKRSVPNQPETTANHSAKPSHLNQDSQWLEAYGKLPLSFEENTGQTARQVRYIAHGGNYELFLTSQEAVVALPSSHLDWSPRHRAATLRAVRDARRNARQANQTTVLRLQLEGSNPQPQISGTDLLPGRVNYFVGNDPKKWHTDVPTYAKVKYVGVYPGVDLIFYGNKGHLEYDFVVAPGANPTAIALNVNGARKMRLNSHGDVVVSVPGGEVQLQKPVIYQQEKGERREVAGSYAIAANHRVMFSIPRYDRNEPLVLDPVLNYSTYVGGSSDDQGLGIAVDNSGDAYITGISESTDFPTTSNGFIQEPLAANVSPNFAAFVAELNPAGTTQLYSSYIAGSTPGEVGFGIAVDPTGDAVYVTGSTLSPDFPTNSTITGFKTGTNSGATVGTSFLVKFDPTQTTGAASFVYSTFIGGTDGPATAASGDFGQAIAADPTTTGVVYVTGYTDCSPGSATDLTTFPIVGGFQTALGNSNGGGNAFLAKINTTVSGSSSLISSSYLGGNGAFYPNSTAIGYGDLGFGVAVDSSANAYVVGTTSSTNLGSLTTTGLNLTYPAGNTTNTSFFAEINTATAGTQSLSYLTYLGGTGPDFGFAIGLGPSNVAYLTGSTDSLNFPVSTGAYQTTGSASGVTFVSLIDTSQPVASSLTYSTFVGGNNGDDGYGIRADSQGNAYVAGTTSSLNFPVTAGALETTFPTGAASSGFVFELNPSLSTLLYSSFFGGSGSGNHDNAYGVALNSSTPPNAYITGQTFSANLPVAGTPVSPLHAGLNGSSDAYVAELTLVPSLTVAPSPFDFGIVQVGVPTPAQAFVATNNTSSTITFNSIVVTGVSPAANTDFAIPSNGNGCSPSVAAGQTCTVNVTFTPSVTAAESATLVITAVVSNGGLSSTDVVDVNLSGTGSTTPPGVGFMPPTLSFGNQTLNTTSTPALPVTLKNTGTGPLTINTIAASGDFAETSTGMNACPINPATLAAGATCTINVTFTPTALGPRTGTLAVTDNAVASPQTVSLTGTGVAAPSVGLTPTSLTFSGQMLTTTSAAQPVTLKNTGTGPLTINTIAASGDFAETSTGMNACPISPATLAGGATCTINVTFAPTAVGARTGTLTITDNGTGSPQTIPLSGTGWDFQVTAPASETGKSPLTFNATMTPLGGFNQSVAFTCTGAPTGTTCTIATPVMASDGMTAQSVPVVVTRTTGGLLLPSSPVRTPPISIWQIVPLILASLLLLLLTKTKGLRVRVGLATAVVLLLVLAGCGGGRPPISGTLTITGTSTGSAGSESHSATVAITVK